jgi:excisionase family DNA binding protein
MKQRRQTTSRRRPPIRNANSRLGDQRRWSPDEGLLTASEVARLLHISRSQVYILMGRGDLPGLKVGRARRFRREDLRRYLSRQPNPTRR